MNKKKRCLALICALAAISAVSGCGEKKNNVADDCGFSETGYPIVSKPLKLTAMAKKDPLHGDWNETYWAQWAKEKSGIDIDFEYVDKASWDQKKQLLFAAKELPDLIFSGGGGLSKVDEMQYGPNGMLVDMAEYIDKYAPNLKKALDDFPKVKANITTPDGNIYALPKISYSIDSVRRIWINQEWLDKLGLKKPETIDELNKVMIAFRDNDPDGNGQKDTYAASGVFMNYEGDFRYLVLRAYGFLDTGFSVDGEKVIYPPYDPLFKEYLKEMNYLYKEGLIDSEYFTQSEAEYKAKSSQVKVGIGCWSSPAASGGMSPEDEKKYTNVIPLTSEFNSTRVWDKAGSKEDAYGSTGCFAISADCKYPEAAMRWADMWYSEEGGIVANIGPKLGEFKAHADGGYTVDENGEWTQVYPKDDKRNTWTYYNQVWAPASGNCNFSLQPEFFSKKKGVKELNLYKLGAAMKEYSQDSKLYSMPGFYFDKEQQNSLSVTKTEIEAYVQKMESKFITGEEPLENFDKYLADLKQYGVETLLEAYQKAYKEYLNAIK